MKKPSKGIRKYIRREKAHIRREVLEIEEQRRSVKELYERLGIKRK